MNPHATANHRSGAVSLVFWLCLLMAVVAYGAVALSPRLLTYLTLRTEYQANQQRLVSLERQVRYFGKVIDALEHDPQFAAELARVDFDAVRPGDERIAVAAPHSLDADVIDPPLPAPDLSLPWYTPIVGVIAEHAPSRTLLLAAAAVLTLFAFTFLHESQEPRLRGGTVAARNLVRRLTSRYRTR